MNQTWLWILFAAIFTASLFLDLFVFHRKAHVIPVKEALKLVGFWVALGAVFNILLYFYLGRDKGVLFTTAYLLEYSLSVDNLFVFLAIFTYFAVPREAQRKVLIWGILGVVVLRGIFIFAGIELIHKFHWLIYVFGGFLIVTGARMIFGDDKPIEPEKNPVVKLVRKLFPVTESFEGDRFFVTRDHKLWATPLFIVVMLIEATDLIFAVDSIPAIISISENPFIVYTSNVFAILGLRSLYFALAGIEKYFTYLKYGLAAILVFVGIKMVIVDFFKIPVSVSLMVISFLLAISMAASVLTKKKK